MAIETHPISTERPMSIQTKQAINATAGALNAVKNGIEGILLGRLVFTSDQTQRNFKLPFIFSLSNSMLSSRLTYHALNHAYQWTAKHLGVKEPNNININLFEVTALATSLILTKELCLGGGFNTSNLTGESMKYVEAIGLGIVAPLAFEFAGMLAGRFYGEPSKTIVQIQVVPGNQEPVNQNNNEGKPEGKIPNQPTTETLVTEKKQ